MNKIVYYAKNTAELLYQSKTNKGLEVVGGLTKVETQPEKAISVHGISDLCQIVKHERYIDIGPGATLSDILAMGKNHIPQVLYDALDCIANPIVRNIATIGGNICSPGQKLTSFASLMALDTKLEFKNQTETKPESILNFKGVPQGYILSNIKVPIVDEDLSIFRRIGPEHTITDQSASFAFIASTEKNTITNIRLAFAGPFTFRSKEFESSIVGEKLPLTHKEIEKILEQVKEEFRKAATDKMVSDVVCQQFFNLTRYSFEQLT